ncbi:hemolysin III family protein [Actinoplanes sp. CA-252034]|uniref:hemolysin III family protein n=1 Tax=Actinoplanes sp. CA-252034 TaxID=3239906 RepID=UPI003D96FB87
MSTDRLRPAEAGDRPDVLGVALNRLENRVEQGLEHIGVLALPPGQARTLLWIVWCGALAGVAFRVLWVGAPRWLYVPVYIALGWVAVIYLPGFWRAGGAPVVTCLVLGGVLYTLGAVVYGLKRPDPSPRWFGFHEVFHALTITAFTTHCIGIIFALR